MTTLEILTQEQHEATLPSDWRVVRLGDLIAEAQAGFACGTRDPGGVIQLRMNNVGTRGNLVWDDVLRVPADAATVAQYALAPGDVVFNNTNSAELVGKSALFAGYSEPLVYSNHFTRLRTKPDALLPGFLTFWLNHQWLKGVFANICNRWVGQTAVKNDKLLNLDFPLPPMPEQRQIVALLRGQMAALEKTRAAAQSRLKAALALPAALAADTVCNGSTRRHFLGDCLIEVRDGVGSDWTKYPVLGATRAGLAPAKEAVGKTPDRYKLVDPVTVFYNPMRILLGSIAMVDEGDATGITSPDYVVVKGRPGVLDTRWFYYWFRSAKGAHLIDSLSRGAVRERILFNRLAAGQIEIPDYEIQRRASEQMRQVRPVVDRIGEELAGIDALPASILRKVFGSTNG